MRFTEPFGGLIPGPQGTVLAALLRTGSPLTGRQVHALVADQTSLWSVQQALASLTHLGVIDSRPVGRAVVHTINEDHYTIQPLRSLLEPIAALRGAVRDEVGDDVTAVILFGSLARGEANADSDIDLAVIAPQGWANRSKLEGTVKRRLGNDCDVLVFTAQEFDTLATSGTEPVVAAILTDGVPLLGALPPRRIGAA